MTWMSNDTSSKENWNGKKRVAREQRKLIRWKDCIAWQNGRERINERHRMFRCHILIAVNIFSFLWFQSIHPTTIQQPSRSSTLISSYSIQSNPNPNPVIQPAIRKKFVEKLNPCLCDVTAGTQMRYDTCIIFLSEKKQLNKIFFLKNTNSRKKIQIKG